MLYKVQDRVQFSHLNQYLKYILNKKRNATIGDRGFLSLR